MLSPSQKHCYYHRREASLKPEGKAAHATIAVSVIYGGSMVAACCLKSGTLSSFSALMLLFVHQEGR